MTHRGFVEDGRAPVLLHGAQRRLRAGHVIVFVHEARRARGDVRGRRGAARGALPGRRHVREAFKGGDHEGLARLAARPRLAHAAQGGRVLAARELAVHVVVHHKVRVREEHEAVLVHLHARRLDLTHRAANTDRHSRTQAAAHHAARELAHLIDGIVPVPDVVPRAAPEAAAERRGVGERLLEAEHVRARVAAQVGHLAVRVEERDGVLLHALERVVRHVVAHFAAALLRRRRGRGRGDVDGERHGTRPLLGDDCHERKPAGVHVRPFRARLGCRL